MEGKGSEGRGQEGTARERRRDSFVEDRRGREILSSIDGLNRSILNSS